MRVTLSLSILENLRLLYYSTDQNITQPNYSESTVLKETNNLWLIKSDFKQLTF